LVSQLFKATMPRKVVALTVEQKREIYFFKKKNPFSSFRQIAKFFTCKFNVPKLSHQRIQSIPPSYANDANDQEIEDREIELELETSRESLKNFTLLN